VQGKKGTRLARPPPRRGWIARRFVLTLAGGRRSVASESFSATVLHLSRNAVIREESEASSSSAERTAQGRVLVKGRADRPDMEKGGRSVGFSLRHVAGKKKGGGGEGPRDARSRRKNYAPTALMRSVETITYRDHSRKGGRSGINQRTENGCRRARRCERNCARGQSREKKKKTRATRGRGGEGQGVKGTSSHTYVKGEKKKKKRERNSMHRRSVGDSISLNNKGIYESPTRSGKREVEVARAKKKTVGSGARMS